MKNYPEKFDTFLSSRAAKIATIALGSLFLVTLVFHAGMVVGSRDSDFNRPGMGREFRPPFFSPETRLPHGFMPNAHGSIGTVTAVASTTLTLETRDEAAQVVTLATSTRIVAADGKDATISVGDQIVVLGKPSEEGIVAKVIRILPSK